MTNGFYKETNSKSADKSSIVDEKECIQLFVIHELLYNRCFSRFLRLKTRVFIRSIVTRSKNPRTLIFIKKMEFFELDLSLSFLLIL